MQSKLRALLAALALASTANAQDMIGISWVGDVYTLSSGTGSGSLLASSGLSQINALARRSDGKIFVGGGNSTTSTSIYEINRTTGAATLVTTVPLGSIRGLAFGPSDVLYAVNDPSAPFAGADNLHTIDLGTGAAPLIGAIGYFGVQGLAYGAGGLYGFETGSGSGIGVGLITIDTSTGVGTDVNPSIGGSANDVQTLAFSAGGTLYGARDQLFLVDVATGAVSLIGGGGYSDLRGVEFASGGGASSFCTSKTSSLGCTPSLAASSATASKGGAPPTSLTAGPVPGGPGLPGILIYAKTPPSAPVLTSFGFLCLSGFSRAGAFPATPGGSAGTCSGVYNWNAAAIAAGTPSILVGDVLRIQAWYRDPGFPPPGNANLTNGVDAVTVVP
jgi:hypothetical protein